MGSFSGSEWLSLSETAKLLGVHPGTVRAWADKGVLPVYRTEGGHRRFRRSEIELWRLTSRQEHAADPEEMTRHLLRLVRVHIGEQHFEGAWWYQKLDEDARKQYRRGGKALLQGFLSYLASGDEEEALAEARSQGYEYASRGRHYQLSHIEAVHAFLFFRNAMLSALLEVYVDSRISDAELWREMVLRFRVFTDHVLLSLLETYQAFEEAKHS